MKTSNRLDIRRWLIAGLCLTVVAIGGATVARLSSLRSEESKESAALVSSELAMLPNLYPAANYSIYSGEPIVYPKDMALDMPLFALPATPAGIVPLEPPLPSLPEDASIFAEPDPAMDMAPFRLANNVKWNAQGNVNGGSGMASSTSAVPASSSPYKGGIGEGTSNANNDVIYKPVYLGGIGEGHHSSLMPIIYKPTYLGGIGDGHHSSSMPMIYKPTYLGGIGDGHHSFSTPMIYSTVYLGGIGDGHHSYSTPMIYTTE